MKKRVEIRIDRLVLHGLPAGQRRAVGEAVERELGLLGARGGLAPGRPVRIPEIQLPPGRKPR